jgi:hypothetical protein
MMAEHTTLSLTKSCLHDQGSVALTAAAKFAHRVQSSCPYHMVLGRVTGSFEAQRCASC